MREARKLLLAASIVTAMACGQIVGLHDPDDVTTAADDGGSSILEAGADEVEITPTTIDVGTVTCGAAAPGGAAKSITIHNKGKTTPKYAVTIPEGSAFELGGPSSGDLAPDQTVTITVTAKPKMPGDNAAEITVTAGSVVATIEVTAKAQGGTLTIAPTTANLGDVRKENGGSIDVAMTNIGNQPITLTKMDSSDAMNFTATWEGASAAPLVLDPGATKPVTVKIAGGLESDVLKAVLTPVVEGTVCGATPTLPVSGKRVNQDVTIGPVDFGKQYCTTSPTLQQNIVISNYTALTLTYTASLNKGMASAFVIAGGGGDTIPPGSTATPSTKAITLGMKPIGGTLGAISELVDVEIVGIGPPSGGKRSVTASADIRGVIFTLSTNDSTGFRYQETRLLNLTNSGNEPFALMTAFVRDPGTTQAGAWIGKFGPVDPGTVRQASVQFYPSYTGYYAGAWTFTNTNGIPMCNGPQKLHVQGSVYN